MKMKKFNDDAFWARLSKMKFPTKFKNQRGKIMRTVKYKFDIDQKVETTFGDTGVVSMLGCDDGGPCYYVKTPQNSDWFKESQLDPAKTVSGPETR